MSKQEIIRKIQALTIQDCLNCEPLPNVHDIRVDLYWCARGICDNCSRERTRSKTNVGDCRHDLLDIADEYLARYEYQKEN